MTPKLQPTHTKRKVFTLPNDPHFRDWETGKPIENFEGNFYSYGEYPGWMRTWIENGERHYSALDNITT